jgi:ribonuclease HI
MGSYAPKVDGTGLRELYGGAAAARGRAGRGLLQRGRSMTALRLYTDGSCHPPGAVGGWAWILVDDHVVASGSGATPGSSTHQACELTAAIEGLAHLVASGVREVTLLSDSNYLVEGMSSNGNTGWAHAAVKRVAHHARQAPPQS